MVERSDVLDRAFQALSDPSRRQIVERLAKGPASVTELARPLPLTLAAVLQHVQVLQAAALVTTRKTGRVRTCSVDESALRSVEQWLADRRTVWERRLDRLGAVLDEPDQPDPPPEPEQRRCGMSVENASWTVEREYPHPPARVFAAWADPRVKVRWFDLSGDPQPDYHGDFRVGGTESFRISHGGRAFSYDAAYRDIVGDERIVTTYEMSVDGRRMSVSVATVELTATSDGTHLSYTEQGAYLDGLDDPQSRRTGTESQLDNLATTLSEGDW